VDDILNNVLWRYNNGDYFATNARAYIFHSLLFEPNRQIFIDRTIVITYLIRNLNFIAFRIYSSWCD